MVVAQPRFPGRPQRRQRKAQARPQLKLDRMALAVIEADRLYACEALERPSQADRRVLPAGKKDEGGVGA